MNRGRVDLVICDTILIEIKKNLNSSGRSTSTSTSPLQSDPSM